MPSHFLKTNQVICIVPKGISLTLSHDMRSPYEVSSFNTSVSNFKVKDIGNGTVALREQLVWVSGPNYSGDEMKSVPLILFPEGCAYRRFAIAALKEQTRSWHLSFVSPSFECLKSAAVEGMGITVLARALVAPPLRIVPHGMHLPQLPTVELVYSLGRRGNSRLVSELANYLADSLSNARSPVAATVVV